MIETIILPLWQPVLNTRLETNLFRLYCVFKSSKILIKTNSGHMKTCFYLRIYTYRRVGCVLAVFLVLELSLLVKDCRLKFTIYSKNSTPVRVPWQFIFDRFYLIDGSAVIFPCNYSCILGRLCSAWLAALEVLLSRLWYIVYDLYCCLAELLIGSSTYSLLSSRDSLLSTFNTGVISEHGNGF
jgi:hypothetical protein